MSTEQINQILKRLAQQDEVLQSIRNEQTAVKNELKLYKEQLEPVHKIFDSVTGFNAIAVWILKGLILIGAGIGVVAGFILWLKK